MIHDRPFNQKFRQSLATFVRFGVFKYMESVVSPQRTHITGGGDLLVMSQSRIRDRDHVLDRDLVFDKLNSSTAEVRVRIRYSNLSIII